MIDYCEALVKHYEKHFQMSGNIKKLRKGPIEKLNPEFFILEIPPNIRFAAWTYLTVGMSLNRNDENLIECFVYSPVQSDRMVELLTINASFHKNVSALNLHHTVNIGETWFNESICDHGFISQPYLDGEEFENFAYKNNVFKIYWFIPISEPERDYKVKYGCEALEVLFEENELDYLNPERKSLV